MVNPFLSSKCYDTETAIMLERANVLDIGNAVAYTDGDRVFLNTQDNLFKILPAYNDDMLKWLLWHERMHIELKHHNRFFKYLEELDEDDTEDKFQVTKSEVNIIMDILVHDWMQEKFPELVKTAKENLAQFRNSNSLSYTFTHKTLEEMLDEYRRFKNEDKSDKEEDKKESSEDTMTEPKDSHSSDDITDKDTDKEKETKSPHGKRDDKDKTEPDVDEKSEQPTESHHDDVDWSKLEDIDNKEFITKREGNDYIDEINKLKATKIRLAQITKTLNGLVTDTKIRSYKTPSYMITGQHTIFKGSKSGKASLYLCFDASGSMSSDMETFKEIIDKAIPQAMKAPTTWFSGWIHNEEGKHILRKCRDKEGRGDDYFKGTFADFMHIHADGGYSDDGDRTIEMCLKAEQAGYSPIGITDGGGKISWSIDLLKQLKRTVFVGHNRDWLEKAKRINPTIQIICTEGRE